MAETRTQLQLRLLLETRCREIADRIAPGLLPGAGFALFMFDYEPPGALAYVSTGERAGIIRLMKEWIARQEGRGDG